MRPRGATAAGRRCARGRTLSFLPARAYYGEERRRRGVGARGARRGECPPDCARAGSAPADPHWQALLSRSDTILGRRVPARLRAGRRGVRGAGRRRCFRCDVAGIQN